MKKKIFLLIFFYSLFFSCLKQPNIKSDLLTVVPNDAILVMETKDLNMIYNNFRNSSFNLIDSIPLVEESTKIAKEIINISSSPVKIITSLHKSGAEDYSFLILMPRLNLLIGNDSLQTSYTISDPIKTYSEVPISIIKLNDSTSYFISFKEDVAILSQSQLLIESAIRQAQSKIILHNNSAFEKIYSVANKKDIANIYINYNELSKYLISILDNFKMINLANFIDWSGLDLDITDKQIILNGISCSEDSLDGYLHLFNHNKPQSISLAKYSPKNTSLLIGLGMENYLQFHRNYKKNFLTPLNKIHYYNKTLKNYITDIEKKLISWVDNEIGIVYSNCIDVNLSNCSAAIIKSREHTLAIENLNSIKDTSFSEIFRDVLIRKLDSDNLFGTIYGNLFFSIKDPYFINFENYFIFSSNLALIKTIINDVLNKSTLNTKNEYQHSINSLSEKSNLLIYGSNPQFLELIQLFSNSTLNSKITTHLKKLKNLNGITAQYIANNQPIHTNLLMQYMESVDKKTDLIWSVILDSTLSLKPYFIKNHYTDNNEILVQDNANILYLINASGEIILKKELNDNIISDIHQIDVYNNNKLQILFNSKEKIYLIDRNGNDLENFPIQLPKDATTPLTLMDYDKNKNYRIIIACKDSILNYNAKGEIVKGWKFNKTSSEVYKPIQLFQHLGKDYILIYENSGKIHVLNRQGESRIDIIESIKLSNNAFYLKKGSSLENSSIINTQENGSIVNILLNGKLSIKKNEEKWPISHIYKLNNDYEMVLKQNTLVVKGRTNFTQTFDADISNINYFNIDNNLYFTAFSKEKNKVFLLDSNGTILENFPIYGTTDVTISSLEEKNLHLILGSEDGTIYNYLLKK